MIFFPGTFAPPPSVSMIQSLNEEVLLVLARRDIENGESQRTNYKLIKFIFESISGFILVLLFIHFQCCVLPFLLFFIRFRFYSQFLPLFIALFILHFSLFLVLSVSISFISSGVPICLIHLRFFYF